jgi:ATP-binding cassette, subfamily B, bacterial PglK
MGNSNGNTKESFRVGSVSPVKLLRNVFQASSSKLNLSVIWRASRILEREDRKKSIIIFLAYAFMGTLDVVAVFTLGIVGSLAVSGIASNQPGNRVGWFLEFLRLENRNLQMQVAILGGSAAIILILKSLLSLYLSRRILLFLSRRSAFISQRLINQLLNQDIISIREKSLQETIYALTYGVNTILVSVFGASILLASDFLLLLIFTFTLFVVDTTVAVSSLFFFVGLGLILYKYMHVRASELGETATRLSIQSNDKISEVVNCYRELLVKDRRSFYSQEIGSMRLSIAEAGAKLSVMSLLSKYIMEIAMVVGGIFVGALQFLTQPASRAVAVISVFLVSSARIVPGVLRIQTGLVGIKSAIATAKPTLDLIERYLDVGLMEVTFMASPYTGQFKHQGFSGSIKIENLTFAYPSRSKKAIDNLSIEIDSGEFIGVVGPSGSGKSTLVDLMLGVLTANGGLISISGLQPNLAIKTWPGAIGYVPQDANFINGTIKDNVCLGYSPEQVPDEEIWPILKSVQLEEIFALSLGIHANIGERGSKLSGGQRQRLGIARALFTQPQLLILDEATSALDATTEAKLTQYLEELKGKLTLVVIAHRLSTVRNADRILYLKEGKVRGIGSFNGLREQLPDFDAQANAMGISKN